MRKTLAALTNDDVKYSRTLTLYDAQGPTLTGQILGVITTAGRVSLDLRIGDLRVFVEPLPGSTVCEVTKNV